MLGVGIELVLSGGLFVVVLCVFRLLVRFINCMKLVW